MSVAPPPFEFPGSPLWVSSDAEISHLNSHQCSQHPTQQPQPIPPECVNFGLDKPPNGVQNVWNIAERSDVRNIRQEVNG